MWCRKPLPWEHSATWLRRTLEANCWQPWKQFLRAGSLSAGDCRVTVSPTQRTRKIPDFVHKQVLPSLSLRKRKSTRDHEVEFYSDDASFLAGLTRFVEIALEAGSKVIVVATESHRNGLLQGLQARGVDTATAAQQERFLLLDAAEALSKFMENAGPSRERFLSTVAPLIRCAEINHKRVELFGEMVALLCADGRIKAAIELERLGNELAQTHPVYIRCAYPMTEELKGEPYAAICAEHSAVLSAKA